MSSAHNSDLRARLNAITNDVVPLKDHGLRIEELGRRYPHRIRLQPTRRGAGFNCFAFAFGLFDQPAYTRIAAAEKRAGGNRFFANSNFADHLVRTNAVAPIGQRDLLPGDIVLYVQAGRPVHAAQVIERGLLRSKWGQGHLYLHHLWEVPARYGHTVRFFRKMEPEPFLVQFADFLRKSAGWPEFVATYFPSKTGDFRDPAVAADGNGISA
ncbi:MAG: hypothetical protein HQ495_11255 [Alphaproteobacteria bacterium]|nr:hypothetical protein [Alphaproteobacteria bacterium]